MQLFLRKFGWIALVGASAIFFYASQSLPPIGSHKSAASTHVSPRYIESAPLETGALNMVTAVLADYRSFDTLGETVVILTAGLTSLLILGAVRTRSEDHGKDTMLLHSLGTDVLGATSYLLTPFIILFATYVLVHGHTSPGGGFQGGSILAASVILIRLIRGTKTGLWPGAVTLVGIASGGVFLYLFIGLISILVGSNFLDYSALPLPFEGGQLRAFGSFIIEVGVFIAVAAVLILIFDTLAASVKD